MKRSWERVIKILRDPAAQSIIAILTLIVTIALGTVQGWLSDLTDFLINQRTQLPNWLILSIVTLIVILSWRLARTKLRSPKKVLPIENKSLPPSNIDTFSLSPRPEEVIQQIDDAPPFQKNNVQQSFEGVKIQWQLVFWDVVEIDNDIAWLQFSGYDKGSSTNIYIHANIKKYPRTKTIKRDQIVLTNAEIEKITDYHTIWLKNATISFAGEI